jgi:hypothetical protein
MFATLVVPLYLVALSGNFPLSVSDTLTRKLGPAGRAAANPRP